MVNPTLYVNKAFKEQVGKSLKETFHSITMSGIIHVLKKYNGCDIALVLFYKNITTNAIKVFRVLSFVFDAVINNYVCIGYICYQ